MPRQCRKISTTGIYHIMLRGVNRENIFKNDEDKQCFMRTMKYCLEKENCILYAYCLMDNHVHLLVQHNNIGGISKFIQNLAGSYATIFNKKYERIGHLFQQRYKSTEVEDSRYFIKVLKYIHQNPQKAGMASVNQYKWSSYREYIYGAKIIERNYVLKLINEDKTIAIKKLRDYFLDGKVVKLREEKYKTREEITKIISLYAGRKTIKEIVKYPEIQKLEIAKKVIQRENVNINLLAQVLEVQKMKLYRIK